MGIDMNAIRGKLNKLQNTQKKSDIIWKPEFGKQTVRIVPYKKAPDNPFIELYFHYNLNNKTYISPISFGRNDPIQEFSDQLKSMGTKEDWQMGKKFEAKLRTFVPVVVRGKENEGVKFWGFGKTVYQELLAYIADEDYGDITDPGNGRDIIVEYTSKEDAGTNFPVTRIRVKPNQTPILEDVSKVKEMLQSQGDIVDLYPEPSYEDLQLALKKFVEGDDAPEGESAPATSNLSSTQTVETPKAETPAPKTEAKPASKVDDVASAFDDIFNK